MVGSLGSDITETDSGALAQQASLLVAAYTDLTSESANNLTLPETLTTRLTPIREGLERVLALFSEDLHRIELKARARKIAPDKFNITQEKNWERQKIVSASKLVHDSGLSHLGETLPTIDRLLRLIENEKREKEKIEVQREAALQLAHQNMKAENFDRAVERAAEEEATERKKEDRIDVVEEATIGATREVGKQGFQSLLDTIKAAFENLPNIMQ